MAAISLKILAKEDIDSNFVSWYQNPDGHLDYFSGSGRVFSKETLINDFEAGVAQSSWFYYLINDEDKNKPIGTLKIGPIDKKNKTADMVCLIGDRSYLGRGLASEAIRLGIEIAFSQYDIRRLHSGMLAPNISSIKAYTRAGWHIEGVMKGFYYRNNESIDRVCVACLNPKYFPHSEEEKNENR